MFTKKTDHKGGGGLTLMVSLTVKYPGFFYAFPNMFDGSSRWNWYVTTADVEQVIPYLAAILV